MRIYLFLSVLTGIIYPLFIYYISIFAFPDKATGSIIFRDNKATGSVLIGQAFTSDRYFWPRPSAVDYNPLPSGASNLGPISKVLEHQVNERKKHLQATHGGEWVPPDLLYASGSGLDPHISREAALYQVARIAKARGMDPTNIRKLIGSKPYLNVLLLNMALDNARRKTKP